MRAWYAVHCKPGEDARAEQHLGNQGYEVFRPRVRVRRGGRRRTVREESMFPRYLFIRLDDVGESWAPIRSTRGVVGLVRMGGAAPVVPEAVIEALKARVDDSGCVDLTATSDYRRNESVRITDGPFAGHTALFQARSGEERVVVLMEIMHKAHRLHLPADAVERE